MKQVKKLGKRQLGMIVLAGLLVLFVVLYIVISAITPDAPDGDKTKKYDPLPGESEDGKIYPVLNTDSINWISVKGVDGEHTYDLLQDSDGAFVLYYTDENGEQQVYYPDICEADPSFSYSSLYATDAFGEGKIARILYLKQGLSSVTFGERIALPEDTDERENMLAEYGFAGKTTTLSVRYEADGTVGSHKITVGGTLISKNGYYLMVDGRPYIYSAENTMLDYAIQPFTYYINPRLVSEGLSSDGTYEPYLATMYRQWKNTLREQGNVTSEAEVVLRALARAPYIAGTSDGTAGADGYITSGVSERTFDLSSLRSNAAYARLADTLTGRAVGTLTSPLSVSVVTGPRIVKIEEGNAPWYTYTIREIEAVLTDSGEISDASCPVSSHNLLKVAYTYTAGGVTSALTHAILDLSDENLPADAVERLRSMKVGKIENESDFVTFDLQYTKDNANARKIRILLTEIMSIYNADTSSQESVAADGSLVSYRYRFEIDGKKQEQEYSITVKLTESLGEVYEKLLGRTTGKNLSAEIASYTEYGEVMQDFTTYEIKEILYFVEREEIVAFRFLNFSERDPFYGESIYENLTSGRRGVYGLSATGCEGAVKFLGGVGSNTSLSQGLVGDETVAVGLTPSVMKKYGLYAHTIYFELPRGITVLDTGEDSDENDNYSWLDTLGVTLYISERQADGSRYMASDLYGIVVRIENEDLRFLEYDFTEYWARQTLLLLDVKDVDALDVEFFMDDWKGKYGFNLKHTTYYITSDGKGYLTPPSGDVEYTEYDSIEISATPSGDDATDNLLLSYMRSLGTNTVSLTDFYNKTLGGGEPMKIRNDSAGTSYFKELLQILYQIPYSGTLTEEEQAAVVPSAAKLMKISLKIRGSFYRYAFEFYRVDDRRVAVRLYRENDGVQVGDAVSDFTISAFSFKKVAYAFVSLLDGRVINGDTAYDG